MQRKAFSIRDRLVGDHSPCFITFEAGPTHSGVDSAIALVNAAGASGADAVKFQIFDPDRLVADKKQMFGYEVLIDRASGRTEKVEEPLYDILARRTLTAAEWMRVKTAADAAGLAFFATIGFEDDIALLQKLGCDSIKIASADVNHLPLIRLAARTGMCLQLDTGNASLGEIEQAVDVILREGNERIIIHQCPSGYPARLSSIHLRMISTLRAMFQFPIAYSDHTPGWEMDIAAVALGANLVEKTITLDRTTRSVEHLFSLEGSELGEFVKAMQDVETALGQPRRTLQPAEIDRRNAVRRSAFLRQFKRAGERLIESDIEFRRPGSGIPPTELDRIVGKRLRADMPAGAMLSWQGLAD